LESARISLDERNSEQAWWKAEISAMKSEAARHAASREADVQGIQSSMEAYRRDADEARGEATAVLAGKRELEIRVACLEEDLAHKGLQVQELHQTGDLVESFPRLDARLAGEVAARVECEVA